MVRGMLGFLLLNRHGEAFRFVLNSNLAGLLRPRSVSVVPRAPSGLLGHDQFRVVPGATLSRQGHASKLGGSQAPASGPAWLLLRVILEPEAGVRHSLGPPAHGKPPPHPQESIRPPSLSLGLAAFLPAFVCFTTQNVPPPLAVQHPESWIDPA